jgi:hypothetical protein
MSTYFGYNRNTSGTVATSEHATVSFGGGGKLKLVQTVEAAYAQRVEARFEAGSADMYWVTGQPQGTISFSRMVTTGDSLLSGYDVPCGEVSSIAIGMDGTSCKPAGGGRLTFKDGVVERVGVSVQVGSLQVAESVQMKVATLST